jgi:SNF2 family DNA or RNA helicase
MLSLLVTRKSDDIRSKTTLIVAPVALMRQWRQEIEQKVRPGMHRLSVFVHHGQAKKKSFRELNHYDVVLTTFGSLAAELKKLESFSLRRRQYPETQPSASERCVLIGEDAKWYRVVLDEAQCIKNVKTQTAKAACVLQAKFRWCMTGMFSGAYYQLMHLLIAS